MKEKQGNKPNSYGKLTKRMLISLGIGGVLFYSADAGFLARHR